MARDLIKVRKRPCPSCPYRVDVPSGIWDVTEYDRLPLYDKDTIGQVQAGALGLFMCHGDHEQLCAGWVGCHDMYENLAVRIAHDKVDPLIYDYTSPVPLFRSGAEAAEHGKRDIGRPRARAQRMTTILARKLRRGI